MYENFFKKSFTPNFSENFQNLAENFLPAPQFFGLRDTPEYVNKKL
jgi:hypothetical protein